MRALIVGCGYLGRRVAQRWLERGDEVHALTRSAKRAGLMSTQGIRPHVGDVLDPASLQSLPEYDVVLYAVGYDREAGSDKRRVFVDGLRNTLGAMGERTGRWTYISSSSVYGQSDGEWVDESSATEPQTEAGRICREAETLLRASPLAARGELVTLRLSGIYGPARLLAKAESLQQRTPLAGRPDAWLNLIHVDDAAQCVVAAAAHPAPQPLYLVCDDQPVTRGEYYDELARLVGAPPPEFDPASTARHGQGLNKRCNSALVKRSLALDWRYPSYRQGLPASL